MRFHGELLRVARRLRELRLSGPSPYEKIIYGEHGEHGDHGEHGEHGERGVFDRHEALVGNLFYTQRMEKRAKRILNKKQ